MMLNININWVKNNFDIIIYFIINYKPQFGNDFIDYGNLLRFGFDCVHEFHIHREYIEINYKKIKSKRERDERYCPKVLNKERDGGYEAIGVSVIKKDELLRVYREHKIDKLIGELI